MDIIYRYLSKDIVLYLGYYDEKGNLTTKCPSWFRPLAMENKKIYNTRTYSAHQ